jgi:hypothetical protein
MRKGRTLAELEQMRAAALGRAHRRERAAQAAYPDRAKASRYRALGKQARRFADELAERILVMRKHMIDEPVSDGGGEHPWRVAKGSLRIGNTLFPRNSIVPDAVVEANGCRQLIAQGWLKRLPAPPAPRPRPVVAAPAPVPVPRKRLLEPESVSLLRRAIVLAAERRGCDLRMAVDVVCRDAEGGRLYEKALGDWSRFPRRVLTGGFASGGNQQWQFVGEGSGSGSVRRYVDDFLPQILGPEPVEPEEQAA